MSEHNPFSIDLATIEKRAAAIRELEGLALAMLSYASAAGADYPESRGDVENRIRRLSESARADEKGEGHGS